MTEIILRSQEDAVFEQMANEQSSNYRIAQIMNDIAIITVLPDRTAPSHMILSYFSQYSFVCTHLNNSFCFGESVVICN